MTWSRDQLSANRKIVQLSQKLELYCYTSEKKLFELFPRSQLMLTLNQYLKISDTSLFVGKFMYFYQIDMLPNVSVKEMFLMTNQVHSYNTRNSNAFFYCFPARTNIRLFGIRFQSLIIPYNRKFNVLLLSLFLNLDWKHFAIAE